MTVVRRKGAAGRADRLYSLLVRDRGTCEARDWPHWPQGTHDCNGRLETAHIVGRRENNTRWDLDNAICLCHWSHQHYFHAHPLDFACFVEWWAADTGRMAKAIADGYDTYDDWLRSKRRPLERWPDRRVKDVADELAGLARLQGLT